MSTERIIDQAIKSGLQKQYKRRTDNHIHVSNLIEFCPREYWLCQKNGFMYNINDDQHTAGRLITFAIGTAIESVLIEALKSSGIYCPTSPIELKLTPDIRIIGTPDAAVTVDGVSYLCEIKTTGKDEIEQMTTPYVNHHCQLTLYLWMASKINKETYNFHPEIGYVIYCTKVEKVNPIKIFRITPNMHFIDRVSKRLMELKTAVLEQVPVKRTLCNSLSSAMAKSCSVAGICFSEEENNVNS